jgi:hypothetical protein
MIIRAFSSAALVAMAGAAAAVQTPATDPDAPSADAAKLLESCSAHKFETVVQFTGTNGKRRQSKVKLCGTEGQTNAQWAVTLRDAARKVGSNASMAPEARAQVIAAIEAELAKIEPLKPSSAAATTLTLPRDSAKAALSPSAPAGRLPEYSSLPPLPAPVAVSAAGSAAATAMPPLIAPRLTVRCKLANEVGEAGSCATMEKATQLLVRADENLPAGLRLRFLRKGDERGEVYLTAMTQGQTLRVRPPQALCAGIIRSSAQIQVVQGGAGGSGTGQLVQTLGPYELRC